MTRRIAGAVALLAMALATGAAQADGDVAKGEKVFRKCKACHKIVEGENAVGPSLFGVVGRPIASVAGFSYSDAMTAFGAGKTWTPELLDTFLTKPKDLVAGTKMGFGGLHKAGDREDVIAYLATLH